MSEAHHQRASTGPAVLDLGPGTGGILIRASRAMRDAEIEVISASQPERRTHVAVLERSNGDVSGWVAVFSGLPAGDYRVHHGGAWHQATVTVREGEVTDLDWS